MLARWFSCLLLCLIPSPTFADDSGGSRTRAVPSKDQKIVTKQASLELTLAGAPEKPTLRIVLRNTGGVPITVDSELVFGVTIELWEPTDGKITPEFTPITERKQPSIEEVKKRLTPLPPGVAISRLVDLRQGWKVLSSATGVSVHGGPLISGYERLARIPAKSRVGRIEVTYGDYGEFWKGFVGLTGMSPPQAGLFLGPMQQTVEIVIESVEQHKAANSQQPQGPPPADYLR